MRLRLESETYDPGSCYTLLIVTPVYYGRFECKQPSVESINSAYKQGVYVPDNAQN